LAGCVLGTTGVAEGPNGAGRRPVSRRSEEQEGAAGNHGTAEQNRPVAEIETKQAAIADYVGHHRYPLFSHVHSMTV